MPETAAPRKMTPTAQAQAEALAKMEAFAARIEEATARNEAALSSIIQLARLLDNVSRRLPVEPTAAPAPTATPDEATARADDRDPADMPRSGRQMYGWAVRHNLIRAVEEIGEGRGFPRRMIEWSPAQARTAYYDLFESEDQEADADIDARQPAETIAR